MKKTIMLAVSFLIFAACANFEIKTNGTMSSQASMTIPGGTAQLSGNPVWVQTSTTRTNVSEQYMVLKLICTNGAIDSEPRILKIKGTSANFNISAIVDVPIDFLFDWNDNSTQQVIERTSNLAVFTVQVGEVFVDANNELQEIWNSTTPTLTILKGRLDSVEYAQLAAAGSSFYAKYIQGKRFLTNTFNSFNQYVKVKNESDDVKIWFNPLDIVSFDVMVVITHTDGSTSTGEVPYFAPSTNKMYEINAHVMAQEHKAPGKTIRSYYIRLSTTIWGAMMNYYVKVENRYAETHNVLYIVNRYGVVETVNCYGELEETGGSESESYTRPAAISPSELDRTVESRSKQNTNNFKINTGHKSLAERRIIRDLLLSPYKIAWLKSEHAYPASNGTRGIVPVVINQSQFPVDNTSDDIMNVEIDLQIAHFE